MRRARTPAFDCAVKIGFLGDAAVGKTSTLRRMLEHRFYDDVVATVGIDFFQRIIDLEPRYRVSLKFWDTGGQERYRALIPAFTRELDVACVLYDVSRADNAASVRRAVRDLVAALVPRGRPALIIVGNKLDMLAPDEGADADAESASVGDAGSSAVESRVRGTREAWCEALGADLVGAFSSLDCVLVSAKSGHNVRRLEEMLYARGRETARSLIKGYSADDAPADAATINLDAPEPAVQPARRCAC